MRAIRVHEFGGPEVLRLDELDDPTPADGEVVIDIKAIGVNPAETYMRTGTYAIKPELPYIPGGDAGGVISAVGAGVAQFSIGDRVAIGSAFGAEATGSYAEKVVRKASEAVAIPDNVSFAQASALGVSYPTAYLALFEKGRAKAGETVFIHGASGSVGTSAIQLAKQAGLTIIGSAGTDDGLALIKDQGVDLAVDHTKDGYIEDIRAFTDDRGVDLTLEMLANVNLAADLDIAARCGRIVIIGNRGEITINPRATMGKELMVTGMALWNYNPHKSDDALYSKEQLSDMIAFLLKSLADGAINPITGVELPLSEASRAHEKVLEPGAHGKVIMVP